MFRQAIIEFDAEVFEQNRVTLLTPDDPTMRSASVFISTYNLNATDAIILRSALDLQAAVGPTDQVVLITPDKRLVRAAPSERLSVFDPEVDSADQLRQMLQQV